MLTNLCYNLIDTTKLEIGGGSGFEVLEARAKALKGLLELVRGNLQTGLHIEFVKLILLLCGALDQLRSL